MEDIFFYPKKQLFDNVKKRVNRYNEQIKLETPTYGAENFIFSFASVDSLSYNLITSILLFLYV